MAGNNTNRAEYRRAYRERHRERLLQYAREYQKKRRANDPEGEKRRTKEYLKNNQDKYKGYKLKQKYGIGWDDYQGLLKEQGGVCAVCSSPPGETLLCVDHDHVTKIVRGLLCDKCNMAIGLLRDNPELCSLAANYLLRSTGK